MLPINASLAPNPNSLSPQLALKSHSINVASHNKYFDPLLPSNNTVFETIQTHTLLLSPTPNIDSQNALENAQSLYLILKRLELLSLQLIEEINQQGNYLKIKIDQTLLDFTKKVLASPTRLPILSSRFTQFNVGYPHNRLNLILGISNLFLNYIWTNEGELIKTLILEAVSCGVSPLERSPNNGLSAIANLIKNNPSPELEFLDFLNSLHPNSLIDFSDDTSGCIFKLAIDYGFKHLSWLAENIPTIGLLENINYLVMNPNVLLNSCIIECTEIMNIRLEKTALSASLPYIDVTNSASSLPTISPNSSSGFKL